MRGSVAARKCAGYRADGDVPRARVAPHAHGEVRFGGRSHTSRIWGGEVRRAQSHLTHMGRFGGGRGPLHEKEASMSACSRRDFLKGSLAAGATVARRSRHARDPGRAGADQGRRPAFPQRHHGHQRGAPQRSHPHGHRRGQRQRAACSAARSSRSSRTRPPTGISSRRSPRSSCSRTRSPRSSAAGPRSAASRSCPCSRRTTACSFTRCSTRARSARRTSSTPGPRSTSRPPPASTT